MALERWLCSAGATVRKYPSKMPGRRRNPSKKLGGVKSCLESNPIPTRDARGLKHTSSAPGSRDPTETETELCLSVS